MRKFVNVLIVIGPVACQALASSSSGTGRLVNPTVGNKLNEESSGVATPPEILPITAHHDSAPQKTPFQPSTPFSRAQRLSDIIFKDVIAPVGLALTKDGIPSDWDAFWDTPSEPSTLATRVALALEQMGPTYVKFGQALSSRPDIVPRSLALALRTLQDQMQPFDTTLAKQIVRQELSDKFDDTVELRTFVSSLSSAPVAAASIGQVYSGQLADGTKVAIKVQRPGIREMVEEDANLLRTMVQLVELIPAIPKLQSNQKRLISTDLSGAVEEFMSRIVEELDYRNEANNIALFSSLYSHRRTSLQDGDESDESSDIQVVVPDVYMDLCTDNVLVMEWIDGTKLVDLQNDDTTRVSLTLIEQGIDCTLSQLLDTGVLHADPHGGNLLKVAETTETGETTYRLGYVDFGLLSAVPQTVRDGLVCAVAELVFARNITAMASLFGELSLIPDDVLSSPSEMAALSSELNAALSVVLVYDTENNDGTSTNIPTLRFDKLLDVLSRLVPRFRFELPPYFLNNARALGTLEGMAREINPSFNVLQSLYPYALKRLLSNPNQSPVVDATLQSLIRNPVTGRVDKGRVQKLVDDSTTLTGYSRVRVLRDILSSKNGPRLARIVVLEQIREMLAGDRFSKMANYHRL
jgi:aarF domain-containing kinase